MDDVEYWFLIMFSNNIIIYVNFLIRFYSFTNCRILSNCNPIFKKLEQIIIILLLFILASLRLLFK